MIRKKIIDPVVMDDDAKIKFLASMGVGDIYPTAFEYDNELTLISLLARKVVELEKRIKANRPDPRSAFIGG